jgi:hypothetical protein
MQKLRCMHFNHNKEIIILEKRFWCRCENEDEDSIINKNEQIIQEKNYDKTKNL